MNSLNTNVTIIGAGPYGLSAAAFLKKAGIEARVLGEPMAFWADRMPVGMFLRSSWEASHIADPNRAVTLDAYRSASSNHLSSPVPLDRFVDYGRWYQRTLVPDVEHRTVTNIQPAGKGFRLTLADGEVFTSRRVIIATGIGAFARVPVEFDNIPLDLASHSSRYTNFIRFKGKQVAVIGGGQSALESAALLHEAGAEVEVIARASTLNWVGLHSWLHHLGLVSRVLYSTRDVGPAGISRLVAAPRLFKLFPRRFQNRTSYRSIRPAGSAWLLPRLSSVPISLGRQVTSAMINAGKLRIGLDDGTKRDVDHAVLATGFQVEMAKYDFLDTSLRNQVQTVSGYPVLKRGLESSVPGLHFLGKPASWSFGPLLCFVSGTDFASKELLRVVGRNGANSVNHV